MSETAVRDASGSLHATQIKVGDQLPELHQEVSATTVVLGALASRDWRPMHHDRQFAIERNGVKDIFINTPNNAAWFERFITDWCGPKGRLGRMKFKMSGSVFPGDTMVMSGVVENIGKDEVGCTWVDLMVAVSVDGKESTSCRARVAVPDGQDDNPWSRRGDQWQP